MDLRLNHYYKFESKNNQIKVIRISFIDYLEKGETINSKYYTALLDRLSVEIMKKWHSMQKKRAVPPRQCVVPQADENDG